MKWKELGWKNGAQLPRSVIELNQNTGDENNGENEYQQCDYLGKEVEVALGFYVAITMSLAQSIVGGHQLGESQSLR